MFKSKRILALLLALVLAVGLLAGCATEDKPEDADKEDSTPSGEESGDKDKDESDDSAGEPVTIKVWHLLKEDNEETSPHQRMLKWAEEFNSNNDSNIVVEVAGAKTADVILTAVSGGDTPDIFMNFWNNTSTWADRGALLDLTDYVNNDEDFNKDDIMPAAWERTTYNGDIYSIPNSYSTSFMIYNKEMLKDAGYDEFPET